MAGYENAESSINDVLQTEIDGLRARVQVLW